MTGHQLLHGECLALMREMPVESVNLAYLDPPFFTGRDFRLESTGETAYSDRWESLDAYLTWLEERLLAIHRLLTSTGTLFLHLDHHTVHYAKVMLDRIYGRDAFLNEIVWRYTGGGRSKTYLSRKHDTILWYRKGVTHTFNVDAIRVPYKATSGYAKRGITSAAGKHYTPDPRGTPVDDVWEIPIINPMAAERTGYPTQKPVALLERIIVMASHPGDVVADVCCGSGTTLVTAARLGRTFIGADVSPAALSVTRSRLLAAGVEVLTR